MGRTVILRHDLPDGTHHFDWMLERDAGGEGLVTFRLQRPIDPASPEPFAAVRIADHRAHYLGYEGPVSGGRGRVERVGQGSCRILSESEGEFEVAIEMGGQGQRLLGRREAEDRWLFAPA